MNRAWLLGGSIAALAAGIVVGRAASAVTIAALRRDLGAAEWAARHDSLTGVLNRVGLIKAGLRYRPGLLVLLDLDGFKAVNDRYGHAVGDALLTCFAGRLTAAAATRGGLAGRLGGDEFVVLLPSQPEPSTAVADLVAQACRPVPHPVAGRLLTVRCSTGVTVLDDAMSWSEALRRADVALYAAKTGRRGAPGGLTAYPHDS